ncbi:Flocculation suppression protein [Kickxella alabastrina]|uniref:Flocculation suppression protein n=1 Tax=Kickxella alabastrina TaxID=61397 RepID=A0ACC1I9U1_9FUNG|nr:Flocculation suppression protein [Kickxella alabastrina]
MLHSSNGQSPTSLSLLAKAEAEANVKVATASETGTPLSKCTDKSSKASASDTSEASKNTTAAYDSDSGETAQKPRFLIQKTHAAFVSKLYAMVSDTTTDKLISWASDGDCFKVTDPMEFSREVLPAYFKHGNWQSFVRQLNMYGFHKINDLAYGGIFGDTQLWMFKHPFFQRGELKMLQKIKRRGPKSPGQQLNVTGVTQDETYTHESAMPATLSVPASEVTLSASNISFYIQPESSAQDLHSQLDAAAAPVPASIHASSEPHASIDGAASSSSFAASFASAATSPASQCMRDYIHELKNCISDLQHSNSQLRQDNQEMRATIASCQNAFAGIMGFLETAIVKPSTQAATSPTAANASDLGHQIAGAFKRLVSEIAPAMSHKDLPLASKFNTNDLGHPAGPNFPVAGGPINASGTLSLAPFRTIVTDNGNARGCSSSSSSSFSSASKQHYWHCSQQTLPPIRSSYSAQSDAATRIPSLSPSGPMSKKRRSSSSSSSNSSEAGDNSLPSSMSHVVLPSISGVVNIIPCGDDAQSQNQKHHHGFYSSRFAASNNSGCWQHQQQPPFSAPLQSSLRETLPTKRPQQD